MFEIKANWYITCLNATPCLKPDETSLCSIVAVFDFPTVDYVRLCKCSISERSIVFEWQNLGWVRLSSITEPNRSQSNDWSSIGINYQTFDWLRRLNCSLRKHPFLLALRRWGRFARRNVCDSATEIPYWWRKICPESGIHCFSYCLRMTYKRQKATKVKCKRDESLTKQSIFVEYSLLYNKHLSFAGARSQMNTTLYQNRPGET